MLIDFAKLVETVRTLDSAASKLLILAAPPGLGKTRLVRELATTMDWPLVNLGKEASERLLDLTLRQRKLKAEEVIADVLDMAHQRGLCLDNTEILFDPALAVNPLLLLQNFSRNHLVVATWSGVMENGSLVHADPEHPEYFKQTVSGFPVVSLFDDKIHLFLAP